MVLTQKTGIILGEMTFSTNLYDGHTLKDVFTQPRELTGRTPKTATVDRGYKGKKMVEETLVNILKTPTKERQRLSKAKKT